MAPQTSELDAEIQRLYSLPLGDFTKERNAFAKRLKKAGREDDSETVEGLPKPTPSAWAVNMLFQRQRDRMDILLDAGRRARIAQGEAVAGAGAEALRDAIGAARILIEDLRRRAETILSEDTGRAPSRAVSERLATNLQSLAFSPSAAEAAQRGWLDRDLEPPGFEVFAGLRIPQRVVDIATRRPRPEPAPKPEKAPPPPEPKPEPVRKPTRAEREAERRREETQKRREAAAREREERATAKLQERLARAEEKVEQAAAEADFLRRKAEQAEKTAAEARRRAEAAEEEAELARERVERAEKALERAQRDLEEVRDGKTASR
jgi:DNA repair exonuclease SbcCD ATPase subunit